MKVVRKDVRGVVVVEVKGKLLGEDRDKFHGVIKSVIDEGEKYAVLDLRQVSYANSIGLGMLVGGLASFKRAGGGLVLAHVTDRIESLLVITQLMLVFECFDTVDEAVDHVTRQVESLT